MRYLKILLVTFALMAAGAPVNAQSPGPSNNGDDLMPPKAIAGKPYSVTPGTEPGTFNVKWGDQSMVWKPKPYMEEKYRTMGPAYYAQWTQPGLPPPWDLPLDKRSTLSGRTDESMLRRK